MPGRIVRIVRIVTTRIRSIDRVSIQAGYYSTALSVLTILSGSKLGE
jgi:hypothetical protein